MYDVAAESVHSKQPASNEHADWLTEYFNSRPLLKYLWILWKNKNAHLRVSGGCNLEKNAASLRCVGC